jgi:tRNA dimethylallyltransferase
MSFSPAKTVIIICGPTAVGKTALAVRAAKHFRTQIISADSRQCYKELNIGVARPSEAELKEIPHHFIASHSIQEPVTAAGFAAFALNTSAELFQQHDKIIMTGGTGLYIKAFCEGLDEIPETNEAIRRQIIARYNEGGVQWLQSELKTKDPQFFEKGEMLNPQRMMRALEVVETTGQSILFFQKGKKEKRGFNTIKIGLQLQKELLHRNIFERVEAMIAKGLEKEVKDLLPFRHLNALQTVGYAEMFDYLDGKISREAAAELIKQHTRQYAKRQMTWFKKDKETVWFYPSEWDEIMKYISA